MESLFEVYLKTTNPATHYRDLLSTGVLVSLILHTILYCIIFYGLIAFFGAKMIKQYLYFPLLLVIVMILGYVGRLYRSKSIYKTLLHLGLNKQNAIKQCSKYMRTGYFTFYFLG